MGYKKGNLFARVNDLERLWDTPAGRTLKLIDQILQEPEIVQWLRERYPVGKSQKGNAAYDPKILLKV